MDISVIIPTYNRAHTLPSTLDSLLAQTHSPYEIIVIDDGSDDSTRSVLTSYASSVLVIYLETNRGVSHARNIGIGHASSPWVAFLDSDDLWKKEKLSRQILFHQQNPDYRISQTEESWFYKGKYKNKKQHYKKPQGDIFLPSLRLCTITPSSVLIHRSVLDHVGLFDETFPLCEDYDLWLRITQHYPVGLVGEELIIKQGGHDDQLSKTPLMDIYRIQALEKHLDSKRYLPEILDTLTRKCEIVAQGAKKRGQLDIYALYWKKFHHYAMLLNEITPRSHDG